LWIDASRSMLKSAIRQLSTAPRKSVTRKLAHPLVMRLGRLHALQNPDPN
jgi:hypothetical protein